MLLMYADFTSRFQGGMIDSLNAEISLGTVASIRDAVQWLGYTYLFVRMRKNPFIYGLYSSNSIHYFNCHRI
jgi:replicative superfamily II helicase